MTRRHLVIAAFMFPSLLGGATGRLLLDRMNRDVPSLATARAQSPAPRPMRPAAALTSRVVMVLVDGVGARYFERASQDGTLRPVTWTQRFDTGTPSLSRPSYHALFTGVSQEASAIRNNLHLGRARADTAMDRLRDEGGTVAWALETVDWMYALAGRRGEAWIRGADARDVDRIVGLARTHTLTVVHWTSTDETAHAEGRDSAAYDAELRTCFERASRVHDALARTFGPRGFTLLVGSDHGHVARGGHGGPEADVVETEWVRLGGERSPATNALRRPETAFAATLTDILGVASPRTTTACAVPFFDVVSRGDCAAIEARSRALDARVRVIRSESYDRSRVRLGVFVAVALVALAGVRDVTVRRRVARAVFAASSVFFASSIGFALFGPGVTLSAIRTQLAFIVHAGASMFVGALLAWPFARRATGARTLDAALATALVPLAALVYTADRAGQAMLDVHGQLLAPAAGLFPPAACAAMALASIVAHRLRSQQEPGGGAPPPRSTFAP